MIMVARDYGYVYVQQVVKGCFSSLLGSHQYFVQDIKIGISIPYTNNVFHQIYVL